MDDARNGKLCKCVHDDVVFHLGPGTHAKPSLGLHSARAASGEFALTALANPMHGSESQQCCLCLCQ